MSKTNRTLIAIVVAMITMIIGIILGYLLYVIVMT